MAEQNRRPELLNNTSFMSAPNETTVEAIEQEIDNLADKNVDSVDSDIRYLAYGARLRTALRAGSRYIAYVCDVSNCKACLTFSCTDE